MGFASEQEQREVQCLSKIYPEIQQALQDTENALADASMQFAVAPPPELKAKIMANLGEQEAAEETVEAPLSTPEPKLKVVKDPNQAPVPAPKKSSPLPWMLSAAALVLSATIGYQYFDSQSQQRQLEETLANQQAQYKDLESELNSLQDNNSDMESRLALIANPAVQKIALGGLASSPDAQSIVYWNPEEQALYFERFNLPEEQEGSQYQLWAIVDGSPLSLGLLDLEDKDSLQTMAGLADAQAFAITLEPLGGSVNPTLEQMVVYGEV